MAAANANAKRLGSIFLFFSLFAATVTAANAPVEDGYWKERQAAAIKTAQESVDPNPGKITEEFNANVGQYDVEALQN